MRLGFGLPIGGAWAVPEIQLAVARRAEELGYASLWTFQRLIYAHEPRDEYYGYPGHPEWPDYFKRVVDPLLSLAYVAAHTERVRLGISVLNVPFTNPVLLAKQLSTLDLLSAGRLDAGVGLGWSRDEYTATGAAWSRRGALFDEFLQCLVAAWTDEEVAHEGEFFQIPRCAIEPKPVQSPHPPLLIGGHSEAALRRTMRFGQGYLSGNLALDAVTPLIHRLREFAQQEGRDPEELRLISRGATALTEVAKAESGRRPLTGSMRQISDDVERYAELGLDELFIDLNMDPEIGSPAADPGRSRDRAFEVLDRLAPLAASGERAASEKWRTSVPAR